MVIACNKCCMSNVISAPPWTRLQRSNHFINFYENVVNRLPRMCRSTADLAASQTCLFSFVDRVLVVTGSFTSWVSLSQGFCQRSHLRLFQLWISTAPSIVNAVFLVQRPWARKILAFSIKFIRPTAATRFQL